MRLRKVFRFRMEPTGSQRAALARMAGARRFVWNGALNERKQCYAATGKGLPGAELSRRLTERKQQPELAWLKEADSQALQQVLADLQRAYVNFFEKRARFPRFKSRKRDRARFRIPQRVAVVNEQVIVPKIGEVRIRQSQAIDGTTKSAAFKRDSRAINFIEPGDPTPKFQTWTFNVQRAVATGVVVQVGYVGSHGTNLVSGGGWSSGESQRVNQAPVSDLQLGSALLQTVPNPFYGILTTGALAGRTIERGQLMRPYPQFTDITRDFPAYGSSIYHAFQAKLETRMAKGINTIVAYTASKNISNIARIQNGYDRASARSLAAFDAPQRLTITSSIDLPFGRGRRLLNSAPRAVDLVAGGWTLGVFNTFQSGFPLEFSVARSTLFLPGAGPQFPNVVGDPASGASGPHESRLNRYFNTDAFAQPPDFIFGNVAARLGSAQPRHE